MSRRADRVIRPLKRVEYEIRFATREAEKGWTDLLATSRSAIVDAWDYLTATPLLQTVHHHPMRADLEFVVRDGVRFARWQHELPGGARIWFYVDGQVVLLVDVHTRHPNQTK